MPTAAPPLTVNEILDRRLTRFQSTTIILCGLVLLFDGFDSQVIGVAAPGISATLGIPLKNLGPVLAAALVGLMIASMASGPIADRVGRRWPIIISTVTFATFAILTAFAHRTGQLILLRFLTGLGLGGSMPNVVALASEYAPRRLLKSTVTILFCGMPLGGMLGALVGSIVIPRWGWQLVFVIGGTLPLALALLLIAVLPESIRFLAVRGVDPARIARVLARVSPDLAHAPVDVHVAAATPLKGLPVKQLFTDRRAATTILLWIPFFMNLLLIYFITSWLVALLRQSGLPLTASIIAVSLFSFGGVAGSLVQGMLMERFGSFGVILIESLLSAALIGSLSYATAVWAVFLLSFLIGSAVQGAQAGLNALAASFYPTAIRSTGIGWALGVGRIGSIVGPILAGALLGLNWAPRQIFLAGSVPALCAAAAVLLSSLLRNPSSAYASTPTANE